MRLQLAFVLIVMTVAGLFCQTQRRSSVSRSDSAFSDTLILIDPLIELPRILKKPPIQYPEGLELTEQIIVYVKATIDTLGKTSDIAIVRGSNTPFDTVAVRLAAEYSFSPGKIDGKVTVQTISWAIEFTPAREQ